MHTPELNPKESITVTHPPEPASVMKAHQYLYYVKLAPVISDYEYDTYCREHNLFGGGGSDMECSYTDSDRALAASMSRGTVC